MIGLDCADPSLVFDRYASDMPHVQSLMGRGAWGPMHTCTPPITVPAWACLTTGHDPGSVGLYGFQTRQPNSYQHRFSTAADLQVPHIWGHFSSHGKRSIRLFVPPSVPPALSPTDPTEALSCFLWDPSSSLPWAHPTQLGTELEERFGPYVPDVEGHRSGNTQKILASLYRGTRQRFNMAHHLWTTRQPDFLMMVEIGTDRLHHALWHRMDPNHPQYDPSHPLAQEGRRYYRYVDEQVGRLISATSQDTNIVIVSDHGAQPMVGGFCINTWLQQKGWLRLKQPHPGGETPTALDPNKVDWNNTRAWAQGGYIGRIQLNVMGREPQGAVPEQEMEKTKQSLIDELQRESKDQGTTIRTHDPSRLYRHARGTPPDLMVEVDNYRYRCLGTLGHASCWVANNDQGMDPCNHAPKGILALAGPDVSIRGEIQGFQYLDFAPTLCRLMGVPIPLDLPGKSPVAENLAGIEAANRL